VELVERLLERGVYAGEAADPNRAITRNKQPGRCCDTGCAADVTPPELPKVIEVHRRGLA